MEDLNKRQEQELKIINDLHFISIKQLAKVMEVSEMTIRRDITVLLEKKLINQVYGGVTDITSRIDTQYSISQEITKNTTSKQKIAQKAFELLLKDDVVFLDTGTTVQTLAEQIPEDLPLTIITPSFNALEAVVKLPECRVICPGGVFAYQQKVFYQSELSAVYEQYRANKCFIGAIGYDMKLGLTSGYPEDVNVKQAMIKVSKEKILLLDSTKYNHVGACSFADMEEFSTVITDDGIPDDYRAHLEKLGIELIVV